MVKGSPQLHKNYVAMSRDENDVHLREVGCSGTGFGDLSTPLQKSLKHVIRDEGYTNYIVEINPVNLDGNFLGLIKEVDISGETADGAKETALFIKESVTLEKITLASVADVYSREQFFYNDLSRLFSRLQDEAKVPEHERFKILKTYESRDNGIIIMENLAKKGFMTLSRKQVVNIKFAELSIVELAKFHALSFVTKNKVPNYFQEKILKIKSVYKLNSDWRQLIDNICTTTAGVLNGEAKDKIKKYSPRFVQLYKKYLQDTVSSNGCVCHGDYKFLNILFKELDGEVSQIIPIDYQLIYFGNPVDDILFFIFTSTDQKFRRQHLNYLKELYLESFAKFLRYFDMDANSTYSREEFEKDYEERLELGLVFGIYVAVFTFAHFEEGFDVSKLSLSELPLIPDEMYEDRVRGIVEDYVEWGYL